MRIVLFVLFCFTLPLMLAGQEKQREFAMAQGDTTYIMKQYVFCLLKRGPNRQQDSAEAARIQVGHLAHIDKLANEGFIHLAGPFGDDTEIRGILVFDVGEVTEAEALENEDPAVKAGRLSVECHPWWTAKGSMLK